MDIRLLNEIKRVTYAYKPVNDVRIQSTLIDIEKKIDLLIMGLFKLKYEITTDSIRYNHQYHLLKSINDLAQITIALVREQNFNIEKTNDALANKDSNMYFNKKKSEDSNKPIENNEVLNEELKKIILDAKEVYDNAFHYFKTKKEANTIIKKEFADINVSIDLLTKIFKLKYEEFDNYDVLINLFQNLLYELVQLIAVLMRAQESNILNTINEGTKKCYFVIMDFVDSSALYPDKLWVLADRIERLNYIISEAENIGLLCNLNIHKQDEVQGVFVGSVDQFETIISSYIGRDIRIAYGEISIDNQQRVSIKDMIKLEEASIFNSPFATTGPVAWVAREKIESDPIIIKHKYK